jgi:hypothetical protein
MYKYLIILLIIPSFAWAEPLTIQVTEANMSSGPLIGTLARTCIYYCVCRLATTCRCEDWKPAGSPHCLASDNGMGQDVKTHTFNVPIYEGDVPLVVRYTATSVNTFGNETKRGVVVSTHTYSE